MATRNHSLVVVNPGHFHAALTLRKAHLRLSEQVYVYAEDGPDLERFLAIVESFNTRAENPTAWKLHVHRGADYLQRLISERPGTLAVVATRNDIKIDLIAQLHAAGFCVLGDKPWIIDAGQLDRLREALRTPPLAMDIMTERKDVTLRLQQALIGREEVFGRFDTKTNVPALSLQSVHFLYKLVNGRPLVRPAWYFDTRVQGEGMTDVNTHLVDLALWMIGQGRGFEHASDVELLSARQWPTEVTREMFRTITGQADFPAALAPHVSDGVLRYLCNAELSCRLRGVRVRSEALWGLAIPAGGGDTHRVEVRGTRARIAVRHDETTGFVPQIAVQPHVEDSAFAVRLDAALAALQDRFPGVRAEPMGKAFVIAVPDALRTTHEEHFAMVLDDFIRHADEGTQPDNLAGDLIAKYTLLAQAKERSHAPG